MTKQKSIKLALISMLSDPDVEITWLSVKNDIREMPYDVEQPYPMKELTGVTHYNITIFKQQQK